MAGPATNAASINIVKNILGKKTMYYYLTLISLTAMIFGFTLDSYALVPKLEELDHGHIHVMNSVGSIILTIIFGDFNPFILF